MAVPVGSMAPRPTMPEERVAWGPPEEQPDQRRKKFLIASYFLAAFATVGLASILLLIKMTDTEASGVRGGAGLTATFFLLVTLPALVGFGLGATLMGKGARCPASVWGTLVWNGLIVVLFVLLKILGGV